MRPRSATGMSSRRSTPAAGRSAASSRATSSSKTWPPPAAAGRRALGWPARGRWRGSPPVALAPMCGIIAVLRRHTAWEAPPAGPIIGGLDAEVAALALAVGRFGPDQASLDRFAAVAAHLE